MQISVRGRPSIVPVNRIGTQTVITTGKWIKSACIHDEDWLETEGMGDPDVFIKQLSQRDPRADIFTFAQQVPDAEPRYTYPFDRISVAAVPLTTYADWWDALPQESRKNVRRAERREVTVRLASFDDAFVQGIKGIYDESPVRQGQRFWHYGKPLETVKRENSSYLERSCFIGAFYREELVGFMKIVFAKGLARMMQIDCKSAHQDKRPANALIAKAVEISVARGMTHLIYGNYVYGNKRQSPLTEFKRRTGFEEFLIPRYYVPLTLKGRMVVQFKLYRGVLGLMPSGLIDFLLKLRAQGYKHTPLWRKASSCSAQRKPEPDVPV